MYHQVDKERFDNQMKYLKNNYNVISLEEFVKTFKEKRKFKKNTVVITFDDGYLNNYINVFPILKKYRLPSTMFVITGLIGTNKLAWWDEIKFAILKTDKNKYTFEFKGRTINLDLSNEQKRLEEFIVIHKLVSKYNFKLRQEATKKINRDLKSKKLEGNPENYRFMNWDQIMELSNNNIEIGAHSITHPYLSNIPKREMIKEIKDCKIFIEEKIQKPVKSFCYPSGDTTKDISNLVKNIGYTSAYTTKMGQITNDSNPYALERIGINVFDDLPVFSIKLTKMWTFIISKLKNDNNES